MCFAMGELFKDNQNIIQMQDFNCKINELGFTLVLIFSTISFCKS